MIRIEFTYFKIIIETNLKIKRQNLFLQVITKHRKIYPTQEELGTILKLTETVERALKRVSDKFVSPAVKPEVRGVVVCVLRSGASLIFI